MLYIGYFIAGGQLGAADAVFGGKVAQHPIRGYALSLSQSAVYSQIDSIRYWTIPQLRPIGAAVLFNTFQTPVTANAAPPSLVNKPFGVCKFTRQDLVEKKNMSSPVVCSFTRHPGLPSYEAFSTVLRI